MDTYSSGEEVIVKARKPYTITKQRERWTEDEHKRFLEALKLYGRAWQRIEAHIGTKTAVQIRSHAQKFFSKLEKEALMKGIPVGQDLDINIPPPRPKRKPSNPYPRKTGAGTPAPQVGAKDEGDQNAISPSHCRKGLDLEREPLTEVRANFGEKLANAKENQDDNCSEVFNVLENHCSTVSSAIKSAPSVPMAIRNSCTFKKFVPSQKEAVQENGNCRANDLVTAEASGNKAVQCVTDDSKVALLMNEVQSAHNFPNNVPVHVLDAKQKLCPQIPSSNKPLHHTGDVHGQPNLFVNPATSATPDHDSNEPTMDHQSFPAFHQPFAPVHHNQSDYQSFLHVSSMFSSLLVSTLLQNPAAHAAASFAAAYWPYPTVDGAVAGSTARQIGPTPSVADLAAATVAAATAWWAAHGLLPLCAPVHTGFTCNLPSSSVVPPAGAGQAPANQADPRGRSFQDKSSQDHQDQDNPDMIQSANSASKGPALLSESEDSGEEMLKNESKAEDPQKASGEIDSPDSIKTKVGKPVDRSSCGSNTTSSSEVETDVLGKQERSKDAPALIIPDSNNSTVEHGNRRRNNSNSSDSWKSVSEEGRLAFQALFSRNVLPQSFSPPRNATKLGLEENNVKDEKQTVQEGGGGGDGDSPVIDLNNKTQPYPAQQVSEEKARSHGHEEGLLTIGLGSGRHRTRRTGFKPYKRCSVEAKEMRVANVSSPGEEQGPKRIRLEGDSLA